MSDERSHRNFLARGKQARFHQCRWKHYKWLRDYEVNREADRVRIRGTSIVSIDRYPVDASEAAESHEQTRLASARGQGRETSRRSSYLISDRVFVPMIVADAGTWHLRAIR